MAEKKMLAPNTTIWWIDKTDVVGAFPAAGELNSDGVNISCAIVEGYTLGSTDPQTDTTRTICDEGNVQNPTNSQYEATLTAFRDADLNDNTSVFNKFYNLFAQPDAEGFLVRRIGKKSSEAAASSDDVEAFGVSSDFPQSVDGGENAPPIQMTVPFLPTGEYSGIYTL